MKRRRRKNLCSLEISPEEEAVSIELKKLEEEHAARKRELIEKLAAQRHERTETISQRLLRCARVVAPSMPEGASVCFRFKNQQAELYTPTGRSSQASMVVPSSVSERAKKRLLYAQDRASGMSLRKIADKYGVKQGTVWASLARGKNV